MEEGDRGGAVPEQALVDDMLDWCGVVDDHYAVSLNLASRSLCGVDAIIAHAQYQRSCSLLFFVHVVIFCSLFIVDNKVVFVPLFASTTLSLCSRWSSSATIANIPTRFSPSRWRFFVGYGIASIDPVRVYINALGKN